MSFIDKKTQKINIHSYFFFHSSATQFYCFCIFLLTYYVQVLCNVRPPPPLALSIKTKMISAEINSHSFTFFFFKHLSHQMESKVRTRSPSRPSEWPSCLNIPESTVKRLGTLKTATPSSLQNKRLSTALEQKHSCCTSSIHGLDFHAYTFNKECCPGRHTSRLFFYTFPHLPSTCVLC